MADNVWDLNKAIEGPREERRNRSDSDPGAVTSAMEEKASSIAHPGGFRRQFVRTQTEREGKPQVSKRVKNDTLRRVNSVYDPFVVGMLTMDDDADDSDLPVAERIQCILEGPPATYEQRFADTTGELESLLPPIPPYKGSEEERSKGKTTTLGHALLALLKSFVGTGVLFLPNGFKSGGILFSPFLLSITALLTLYAMLRLLHVREIFGGSFGSLGERAFGNVGRRFVQVSIVLMQMGFCTTYVIFVAQNMQDVLRYIGIDLSTGALIALQILFYVPLSWVRYVSYFAISNLVADAFILYGMAIILGYAFSGLATSGPADVELFNPQDYSVFVGTAVFTFEGIGLGIPTVNSLNKERQQKFKPLLCWTMLGLFLFFASFGAINYLTYGSEIQPIVTTSLPQSGLSVSVQFGYSIAQMLSYPLFLFPAVQIIEDVLLFPQRQSGKKAQKNAVRSAIVLVSVIIAYYGQKHLDLFVSLVGAVACVPLSFIYPPLFCLKLLPNERPAIRAVDMTVVAIGLCTLCFVTFDNIRKWKQEMV